MQDFSLPATGNTTFTWQNARGKKLVVYFYPKDDTPGCTTEGRDFAALYAEFTQLNTEIIGISRDSVASHEAFKAKLSLPFALLADTDETVCRLFDVIKPKMMYGKEVMGVQRSTFLFDEAGQLMKEWRGISSTAHAQLVLDTLKTLLERN